MRLSPQAQSIVDSLRSAGPATDNQLANRLSIPQPSARRARREAEMKGAIRLDLSPTFQFAPLTWKVNQPQEAASI